MSEILVVLCGGTIGSRANDGEISLAEGGALIVADNYKKTHSDVHFTIKEPFCVSSEEINDSFYVSLINYFKNLDLTPYDGVIITHGTDTLSFTAPIFSFACCDIEIPVVFVSADYVPDDVRSNANRNFSDAVSVIESGMKGVFSASDGDIILASRLCEADWLHNRFTSFDGRPIMTAKDDGISINNLELSKAVNSFRSGAVKVNSLDKKILMITPYPGIDYNMYEINGAEAVLHLLYHSATADSAALESFIKKCKNAGKDFYIAPVKNGDMYSSTKKMLNCGAVPIFNTSREAALAKLKIAYNSKTEMREEIINSNIYFEQI